MELPDDLKNYRAPEPDAFQLIEEGSAFLAFAVLLLVCLIFWPYIK